MERTIHALGTYEDNYFTDNYGALKEDLEKTYRECNKENFKIEFKNLVNRWSIRGFLKSTEVVTNEQDFIIFKCVVKLPSYCLIGAGLLEGKVQFFLSPHNVCEPIIIK